jgi:hypothetical protein
MQEVSGSIPLGSTIPSVSKLVQEESREISPDFRGFASLHISGDAAIVGIWRRSARLLPGVSALIFQVRCFCCVAAGD